MEQERARAEHELAKKHHKESFERKEREREAHQQHQLQMQAPPKSNVPTNFLHMKKMNDQKVVGRYKVVKKSDLDKNV